MSFIKQSSYQFSNITNNNYKTHKTCRNFNFKHTTCWWFQQGKIFIVNNSDRLPNYCSVSALSHYKYYNLLFIYWGFIYRVVVSLLIYNKCVVQTKVIGLTSFWNKMVLSLFDTSSKISHIICHDAEPKSLK